MPVDLPPQQGAVSGYTAPAPECRYLTALEAQEAFNRLRSALPGTRFDHARPSEICGLVRLQLANGKTAYTDASGRYFLLAFALDTHKGGPADNDELLSQQMQARERFPKQAIPGVMPAPAPVDGALMTPIPATPYQLRAR